MHRPTTPRSLRKRSHKWQKRTFGAMIVLTLFVASALSGVNPILRFEAIAQDAHTELIQQNHLHEEAPKPVVDGAEHPELVPDDLAIRLLMTALRVPNNPDPDAVRRVRTRIARAGLDEADFQILLSELGSFDSKAKYQESIIESLRPQSGLDSASVARYVDAGAVLNLLYQNHYHQIIALMSIDGATRLQNHLLHVKSRIKIFPTPAMRSTTSSKR